MYDMRHPFGSSCRVTSELRIVARKTMPSRDTRKTSGVRPQGLRDRGLRPTGFGSGDFSISSASTSLSPASTTREAGVAVEWGIKDCLAKEPFREEDGFQLKLPDRLLRVDEDRRSAQALRSGCSEWWWC